MSTKFGYLGMGIMGSRMCQNLLNAGLDVTVWNRTPERCLPLVHAGAKQAKTPAEVIRHCDITFACVSDPIAAEDLCYGEHGVAEGMAPGKGYIDMSTIDVATSQRIEEVITIQGGKYLESPVLGSKKPAEDGTLVILTAGDFSLHEAALPAFQVMGKKSVFLGHVGQAATTKLILNSIMGAMMTAFAEGITLAEKAGLDIPDLLDILDNSAINNPMFRTKGPLLRQHDLTASFPLKHAQKDLRLALLLADQLDHSMPTIAASNEMFKLARLLGLGNSDFSAVSQSYLSPEHPLKKKIF